MRYYGNIFRPPSEAYSLLLQITYGCSHNKCTFCGMYADKEFKVRPLEDILYDIENFPAMQKALVRRVFLIDGNPLCIGMDALKIILDALANNFKNLERVGAYSTSRDIVKKTVEDLKILKEKKLNIIYIGVESGSDKILRSVKKDSYSKDILAAAPKLKEAGIKLSTMILSGLGGSANWQEHALESAKVISQVKPDYLSLLTLMAREGTELERDVLSGKFKMVSQIEVMKETRLFIENLDLDNTVFRVSHPSNLINLGGVLNKDKEDILNALYSISDEELMRAEFAQIY